MGRRLRTASVLMLLTAATGTAAGQAPRWTDWEQANSVAKEGDWLVIRQPEAGFCYMKQGYDGHGDKMDLAMQKDGVPYLTTPFFKGVEGDLSYRVDDGPLRLVEEENARVPIKLSREVVQEMRSGQVLVVRVKPVGRTIVQQRFSLRGFAAAAKWLGSPTCREKVPERS